MYIYSIYQEIVKLNKHLIFNRTLFIQYNLSKKKANVEIGNEDMTFQPTINKSNEHTRRKSDVVTRLYGSAIKKENKIVY